jgi:hypothetical protein
MADKWKLNKNHPLTPAYEQWVDDCHIYALLHTSNNMTAMRDVDYKGKKWNIHNHFFWLTRQEAIDLYTEVGASRLLEDALKNPIPFEEEAWLVGGGGLFDETPKTPQWRLNGDPYFAHILPSLNLSPLAKEIIDELKVIHKNTALRREDESINPDLHLTSWDAGVYQLKKLLKGEAEWEAIWAKFKQLEKSLEHGVYTFGFLKK